jgi:hypothetical protein
MDHVLVLHIAQRVCARVCTWQRVMEGGCDVAFNTPGQILALLVIVVCVVAAVLVLLGQGLGASTNAVLAILFVLIGVTAVTRLI